jgi:hypothetical protein
MSEMLRPTKMNGETETGSLASDLAHAYGRMVTFYRDQMQMSAADADAHARGTDDTPDEAAADLARIRDRPPDQVSWFDLERVVERDPEAMTELWQGLRVAAREELASGHRTAKALDWDGHPWDRARFLAIRDSFRADHDPSPGIESALVDLAAEAFGDYLAWSEQLHMQAATEVGLERHGLQRHGAWKPQRIGSAEAMEDSARNADRAHLRFLRTLKAIGDLRRPGPVHVHQAGQVNVGAQQVIVARLAGQGEEA